MYWFLLFNISSVQLTLSWKLLKTKTKKISYSGSRCLQHSQMGVSNSIPKKSLRKRQMPIRKKISNNLNRHFTEKETWIAEKHVTISSPSLAIRAMQIHTKIEYHFIPSRLAEMLRSEIYNIIVGEEQQKLLHPIDRSINCSQPLGKQFGIIL